MSCPVKIGTVMSQLVFEAPTTVVQTLLSVMFSILLRLIHFCIGIGHPVLAFSNDLPFAVSQMSDSETHHTPPRPQAETQKSKYDSHRCRKMFISGGAQLSRPF